MEMKITVSKFQCCIKEFLLSLVVVGTFMFLFAYFNNSSSLREIFTEALLLFTCGILTTIIAFYTRIICLNLNKHNKFTNISNLC